jgi:hypothetical protein
MKQNSTENQNCFLSTFLVAEHVVQSLYYIPTVTHSECKVKIGRGIGLTKKIIKQHMCFQQSM